MNNTLSRRRALKITGAISTGSFLTLLPKQTAKASPRNDIPDFYYCLNTGTIRGQKLGIVKEIEVTAQAGYDAIEPWVRSIQQYVEDGGSLMDLRKRIEDAGLTVESAIAFSRWIVDDESQRTQGFEDAKRDMDILAQIGGKRIAAPPAGATNEPGLNLLQAAERYHALLELGKKMGVIPQIEVWGFSKNLHRLGESMFVAIESGHPDACLLPDVFHIYKGGSDFTGLQLLSAKAIQVFHMNDYPADPPREKANDSHRVYPGDGVAPLNQILQSLYSTGKGKVLSLELFNRSYWEQDALQVAKTGLAKMKEAVNKALRNKS